MSARIMVLIWEFLSGILSLVWEEENLMMKMVPFCPGIKQSVYIAIQFYTRLRQWQIFRVL